VEDTLAREEESSLTKSKTDKVFFGMDQGKSTSSPGKDGDTTTHEMNYIFSPGNVALDHHPATTDMISTLHSPPSLKPVIAGDVFRKPNVIKRLFKVQRPS
jgi:hypothetical protein